VEHSESGGNAVPRRPDGPPPARERLPLPRRRRQAHLEPQLRTPGSSGSGTPFSAFSPAPGPPVGHTGPAEHPDRPERRERPDRPDRTDRPERPERHDRAAAFHAGTRRGRGAAHVRRSPVVRRAEPGHPYALPPRPESGR
jgi:hypothetical protein